MEAGCLRNNRKAFDRLRFNSKQFWKSRIDGHIKCDDSKHAFALYQKVYTDPTHPSVFKIVALLKNCAKLKDKERGCALHAQITESGSLQKNILVGTALVDMYAKCGMLAKAQDVFDKLSDRDVVLWNALISGYAQNGRGEEALNCFIQMERQGIVPDDVTLACSLKACGLAKAIGKGEEVHKEIKRRGLLKISQIVGNALVDMYAKCGSLVKARQVFDTLPVRNLVSWNALITGYAQNEHGEEALHCFEQMRLREISPDAVTFACVLKACGSIGARDKGQEIHRDIEKIGSLRSDQLVGNALVDMYGKFGMLLKAHQVFNELRNRDVISWNALIAGYVHHEHGAEALKCFEQMQLQGPSPSAVTFACCLKACGSLGATEKSREIHAYVENSGLLKRNQVVGNALVDVYAKCGVLSKAQEVFDMLPVRNVVSWNSLITGYAQLGEVEIVLMNFDRMRREGFDPNLVTFRVVLSACRHAGLVDKAQTYFEAMSQSYGVSLVVKHQTCIVDLLSRAGQLETAVAMMKEAPSHPNNVMWLTVLGACRKWGNKDLGDQAFEQAELLGENRASAYICLYNIYADASVAEREGGHDVVTRNRIQG